MPLNFNYSPWWIYSMLTRAEVKNRQGDLYSSSHLFTGVLDRGDADFHISVGSSPVHLIHILAATVEFSILWEYIYQSQLL